MIEYMRTFFATKLALKKLLGRRPNMPWRAIRDIALEPPPPGLECSAYRKIEETDDGLALIEFANGRVWYPKEGTFYYLALDHASLDNPRHPHFYERSGTVVETGDVVIDCGACEGFFARRVIERAGQLHLFEPVPKLAECLKRTFAGDLKGKVSIWQCALGAESQAKKVLVDSVNYGASRIAGDESKNEGIPANVITLDDFVESHDLRRVDYIKIDVEGMDLDLLRGARRTLARCLPKVAVTTYHVSDHARSMIKLFREASPAYRCGFAGTEGAWENCRPLMARFWVEPSVRKAVLNAVG